MPNKIPPPPLAPGMIPKGSTFGCSSPYCSGRESAITCGMKHNGTFYNSVVIKMGITADCVIQSLKDLDLWDRYKLKPKGEEDPDFYERYFPDPEKGITLRYASVNEDSQGTGLPDEDFDNNDFWGQFVFPEQRTPTTLCSDVEEPGCDSPPSPFPPQECDEEEYGCGGGTEAGRPLSPHMGGTTAPSKEIQELIQRFLEPELGNKKTPSIRPIDPLPPGHGEEQPSGGGGFSPTPYGPGVMTPIEDELPDSMKKKLKPLISGVFPELFEESQIPRVLGTGPRPYDPPKDGTNILGNPRPIPKPGPVDPTIARASKKKHSSTFSLAATSQRNSYSRDPDELL